MTFEINRLIVTDLSENCYILNDANNDAIVVDPGGEVDRILQFVEQHRLKVGLILNTHGHADHICAARAVKKATGAQVAIHPDDAPMMASALLCGAQWLEMDFEPMEPDFMLEHGKSVSFGSIELEVRHTPGHSPGSCIFIDHEGANIFTGDLIFRGAVGRWDLPGGDGSILKRSLHDQILTLPHNYRIHPGHGDITTVGDEARSNPFLQSDVPWQ